MPPPEPTPLIRAPALERSLGVERIWLKWEGAARTGTHKERLARLVLAEAAATGHRRAVLASCGNYGRACAALAGEHGVTVEIVLPGYAAELAGGLAALGAEVRVVAGDYHEAVAAARRAAAEARAYDATPGTPRHTAQALRAYGPLADEIVAALGAPPDTLVLPLGNGSTLAALWERTARLADRAGARRPRMVATTARHDNPVARAWRDGGAYSPLSPAEVSETPLNASLACHDALDGPAALTALRASGGAVHTLSDDELLASARALREHTDLAALPASASVLVGARALPAGVHVLIVTAREER